MRDGDDWSGITASSAVEVVVGAEEVDLASGLLWGAGVTAVAEHPAPGGRVRLRADLPDGGVAAVGAALGGRWDVVAVEVADDGLDAWREHARVVTAGRRLVVRPPWVPLGEVGPDAVVLEIDPGRTFGHGAHPTTRLCLAAVEDLLDVRPGATVLDVGCGSGVLAVAAARLGAGWVVAVDVDPAAVAATEANAAGNGVADRVAALVVADASGVGPAPVPSVLSQQSNENVPPPRQNGGAEAGPSVLSRQGNENGSPARQNGMDGVGGAAGRPDGGDPTFDVVVANIGARTLGAMAPWLRARTADGGTLVLSGLLDPPPPEVNAAFAPAAVVDTRHLDGWTALLLAG